MSTAPYRLESGLGAGDLCYIQHAQTPARILQILGRSGGPNVLLELPDGTQHREYAGFIEPLDKQLSLFERKVQEILSYKDYVQERTRANERGVDKGTGSREDSAV